MRVLRRIEKPLFVLACAVAVLAMAQVALEQSGFVRRRATRLCAALLGERGRDLELAAVRLSWFAPGLEVRGLQLGPADPAGRRPLEIERARIELAPLDRERGRIARIDLEGVRVHLGHPYWQGGEGPVELPGFLADARRWPSFSVRDLEADWLGPAGSVPLGRLEAGFAGGRLAGRWQVQGAGAPVLLAGSAAADGSLELRAAGRDLDLGCGPVEGVLGLVSARAGETGGRLGFDLLTRLEPVRIAAGETPRFELSAGWREGRWTRPGAERSLSSVQAACQVSAGGAGAPAVRASATALWGDTPLDASLALGTAAPPGERAHAILRATDVPLDAATLNELGLWPHLERIWNGVQPAGRAALALDLTLADREDARPEVAVELSADGRASVEYRGLANPVTGGATGFPMRADAITGSVLVLLGGQRRRGTVALLDLRSSRPSTESGPARSARAEGVFLTAPEPGVPNAFELWIEFEGITADDELRRAVEGLPRTDWLWPELSPAGGRSRGTVLIRRPEGQSLPAVSAEALFEGLDLSWSKLPVPLRGESARLTLEADGQGELAVACSGRGTLRTADLVRYEGVVRTVPGRAPGAPPAEALSSRFQVSIRNASLRGDDVETLTHALPRVAAALDEVSATGKVDATLDVEQDGHGIGLSAEIVPRRVELLPRLFPVPARELAGRLVVDAELPFDPAERTTVSARAIPLLGSWTGGARMAVVGSVSEDGSSRMELLGARVRGSDRNLVAALSGAIAGGGTPPDLGSLEVRGRVDMAGVVETGPGPERAIERAAFLVHLRGNDIAGRDDAEPRLKQLVGPLVADAGGLTGRELGAVLGHTPVRLSDLSLESLPDGGFELETGVAAQGLPLDREHLGWIVAESTLGPLIDELEWRGEVDLDAGHVRVRSAASGELDVALSGQAILSDAFVRVGLPLRISSARVDLEELRYQGGRVRGWARVDDLFGSVAGRALDDASAVLTYYEPRVNVLDLDGQLEGGRIRGLVGQNARTGPVFSLDLAEPFRFELGARLDQVDVHGLLEELFESTVESRGLLSGTLRLTGNLRSLLTVRASGGFRVAKARLWSLPAVPEVLLELGLDKTSVFDEVSGLFQLERGLIRFTDLRVESPLLNLVGTGGLDLDGSLHFDMQVRYGPLEDLGPITRFLHWIQNNLITIAVRGNTARPEVFFRGAWGISRARAGDPRSLPLPAFTPLPQRF